MYDYEAKKSINPNRAVIPVTAGSESMMKSQ